MISLQDLLALDSESIAQLELTPGQKIAIADNLDKVSAHLRQSTQTVSENFRELVDELVNIQLDSGYSTGWVYYRITESWDNPKALSIQDWKYLAEMLDYHSGWAFNRFQEAQC